MFSTSYVTKLLSHDGMKRFFLLFVRVIYPNTQQFHFLKKKEERKPFVSDVFWCYCWVRMSTPRSAV
jgi:hypothetical protein